MNAEIEQKREELVKLCRLYGVHRLSVFGSALGESFDPLKSDFDFLVEFKAVPSGGYAEVYFGLLEGLEKLFHRPVDLVVESAIKNPYFRESIQLNQMSLYAA